MINKMITPESFKKKVYKEIWHCFDCKKDFVVSENIIESDSPIFCPTCNRVNCKYIRKIREERGIVTK